MGDREQKLGEHKLQVSQLQKDAGQLRADLQTERSSHSVCAEDLAVMTRENGILNEKVVSLARERGSLNIEKTELQMFMEKELETKRIMELERDDLVQLYKETYQESTRREEIVRKMQFEKVEGLKKVSDYMVRTQQLSEAEEKAVSEARQQELNVRTLKQQVTDLVARLEDQSSTLEASTRAQREVEQDLFMSGP